MAKHRPLRIGDDHPSQVLDYETNGETIDGKIHVTGANMVLGSGPTGNTGHIEIPISSLGGGGGSSYESKTYAEMETLIAADGLTPGGWYLITDAAGTDLGVFVAAISENAVSSFGAAGYAFDVDEWDSVEYNFADNTITYRADKRGNVVRGAAAVTAFPWGYDNVAGNNANNATVNLTINPNASYLNNTLFSGAEMSALEVGDGTTIENNILENGAQLTGITAGENCSISGNKIGQGATIGSGTTIGDGARIDGNSIGAGSDISQNTLAAATVIEYNTLSSDAKISNNEITDENGQISGNVISIGCGIFENEVGARGITGNTFLAQDGNIRGNVLLGEAGIGTCTLLSGSEINYNEIEDGSGITSVDLASGSRISNKTLSGGALIEYKKWAFVSEDPFSLSEVLSGTTVEPGFSDIPRTFDIEGLTTLDFAAGNYIGIANLTSGNATEEIDQIDNPPELFPFTIRPAAGLTLTVTGTAYSGISAGQMSLNSAAVALDGDTSDFLTLVIDPLGTGALIETERRVNAEAAAAPESLILVTTDDALTMTTAHTKFVYNGTTPAAWDMFPISTGAEVTIHNISTETITLTADGGNNEFHDLGTVTNTKTILSGENYTLFCDGTYFIIF